MQGVIEGVFMGIGVYLCLGGLFGLVFVTRGVQRLDAGAEASSPWFRILILPASIALWPLLLSRWARNAAVPAEDNAHRRAAAKGGA